MANVSLNQDGEEVINGSLRDTTANHTDAPRLERVRVGEQEFLSTEIPASRSAGTDLGSGASTTVLYFWWLKEPSLGDGHVRINLEAKMIQVGVRMPLKHTHAMLDGLDSVTGSRDSKFDHGSRLVRAKLGLEALVGVDNT